MKKTTYLLCLSLLMLGGSSCQKEKTEELDNSREPLVFSASTPRTKGQRELDHLDELANQDFSVSAWYTAEGKEFGNNSLHYLANHRFGTLDNQVTWQGIARSDNNEASPDPVYYPLDGSLSFFCYAPYRNPEEFQDIIINNTPPEGITNKENYLPGSPVIQFTPESSAARQIDFIASDPVLDWKKGDGIVPLNFTKHLTTKIQFWCKYEGVINNEEKVLVDNIMIHNVIGSEYLYFTQQGGKLGYAWCSDVSPDGGETMPRNSYSLSIENKELINDANAYLDTEEFKFVNAEVTGKIYLLPQVIPPMPEEGAYEEEDFPYLQISYQILNKDNQTVEKNTLKYDLRGSEDWPIGKTVVYTITIKVAQRKELVVNSVVINDWEDAGNTHNPEELLY